MFRISKAKFPPFRAFTVCLPINDQRKPKACRPLIGEVLMCSAPYLPGHSCHTNKEWLHLLVSLLRHFAPMHSKAKMCEDSTTLLLPVPLCFTA